MDGEIVCSNVLSRADFITLLMQSAFLQQGTFLGECLPLHVINVRERDALVRFAPFDNTLSYETYTQYTFGRIFHPDFELRWQHDSERLHVLYIGTTRQLPFLHTIDNLKIKKRTERQYYYLFGERVIDNETEKVGGPAHEGDFAEVRIPRLLHYPVKGQRPHVQVVVQEYLDEETKQVALYRFVSAQEAQ